MKHNRQLRSELPTEPATTPPPAGASDVYSAETRLAPLSSDVLASMREQAADPSLIGRTHSGLRRATRVPPPLPVPWEPPPPLPHVETWTPDPPVRLSLPSIDIEVPMPRSGIARSLMVIGAFTVLGALVAICIAWAGW